MKKFVDGEYIEMNDDEINAFYERQAELDPLTRLTLEIDQLKAEIDRLRGGSKNE